MTALPLAEQAEEILPREPRTPLSVYRTFVLPAEEAALNLAEHQNAQSRVIHARVIGYLLLYPPSPQARTVLAREISSCSDWEAVYDLGAKYIRHFIILFRKSRGKTPVPSSHPSRPSFDHDVRERLQDLQRAPRDHSSAKVSALARDNYRCMVTGRVDTSSYLSGLTPLSPGEIGGYSNCCHIFPDSLGDIVSGAAGPDEHESATVWTILKLFGYEDICEELGFASRSANLHRLENIMTLDMIVHEQFDRMNLWFQAIDGQNTYNVVLAPAVEGLARLVAIPEQVTFVSHRPELPLPSPKYLRIHAACCRIAHLSGAAEHLDVIFRDMEELNVLAHDGSSADVLTYALHHRLAAGVQVPLS
ncbi:hypothetical protein FKP32DRAFT_1578008 [Trametes sanguinea]|nr:hypothetical protein FKP32DRAFT_1578008 [Trametes sanguinea]